MFISQAKMSKFMDVVNKFVSVDFTTKVVVEGTKADDESLCCSNSGLPGFSYLALLNHMLRQKEAHLRCRGLFALSRQASA